MLTQKIQITLTPEEAAALSLKGKSLGYNVTKYIKFVVSREALDVIEENPVLKMSPQLEKRSQIALKEHKAGKSKKLGSLSQLDTI